MLGFGVPVGEFGDARLVLGAHELDDDIEGFVGMGDFAASEFKLLAELGDHYFGFEEVELAKIEQNESFSALNKELIKLFTSQLGQGINHIAHNPVKHMLFIKYAPIHQPLTIIDISINR